MKEVTWYFYFTSYKDSVIQKAVIWSIIYNCSWFSLRVCYQNHYNLLILLYGPLEIEKATTVIFDGKTEKDHFWTSVLETNKEMNDKQT